MRPRQPGAGELAAALLVASTVVGVGAVLVVQAIALLRFALTLATVVWMARRSFRRMRTALHVSRSIGRHSRSATAMPTVSLASSGGDSRTEP